MATSRNDDLDWLYRRPEPENNEPEHTRVLPPMPADEAAAGPSTAVQPPVRDPRHTQQPGPAASRPPQQGPRSGGWQGGGGLPPQGPPPGGGGVPVPTPGKRRHPVRTTFRALGILLLVFVVGLVAVPVYAWSKVSRVDEAPDGARPPDQPGTTILLVGSDSREGLTKAERKKLGTGRTAGGRTDTIMLMYVPVGGDPVLISIPRDSFVPIPDNGRNKINAAYSFGGPKLLVNTVEQNTGLRVDGYVEVGFGGFVNVIDALGGIRMCLPKAIKDKDSHLNLKKGCHNLAGADALGYVRMRKADPRGDLGRVERQRAMLSAMVKKGASPASVLNPVRYWQLNNAAAESVTLGEKTSARQLVTLALGMRKVSNGTGLTLTVPISDPNASTSAGSAVLWDQQQAKEMFGDIARGDTSNLKKFAKK
ncbi:LCP family protein [Microlunatus panaciterrae]|uniref:LCP family protein required for cell wall assembly n=1 Tax=Microlunatus panaciterrae TaxID=400768 RepID=A0ABS2RNK6_9ACTN|nr:LCP family protein [Microlunatus panaciterrae]MBM7799756.1 LCP family protein required for cell wall assembly [Microlunatus panaciterrae]